ncbi:DUF1214 domain-containing protein [Roseibium sp.]|uniref:DUF1214 domain-containing protein n=1 Tax=Roseibium sp. TaxID=1936156 RepID=UPI003A979FF4
MSVADDRAASAGQSQTRSPRVLSVARAKAQTQAEAWGGHDSLVQLRPDLHDVVDGGPPKPLRGLMMILLVLIAGSAIGIGSAALVIQGERPFTITSLGPWTANPYAGTDKADPYSVAIYTRSARVPLAQGEGLALTAYDDSSGRPLSPDCTYEISGTTPTARLWTLTAANDKGDLAATMAGRTSLASPGLLRNEDGSFQITASRTPSSGNWLPLANSPDVLEGLSFTFRLYDAPVTTGASLEGAEMPDIRRLGCR